MLPKTLEFIMKNKLLLLVFMGLLFSSCEKEDASKPTEPKKVGEEQIVINSKPSMDESSQEDLLPINDENIKLFYTLNSKVLKINDEEIHYSPILYKHEIQDNKILILDRNTDELVVTVVEKNQNSDAIVLGDKNLYAAIIHNKDKAYAFINNNNFFDLYLILKEQVGEFYKLKFETEAPLGSFMEEIYDAPAIPMPSDKFRKASATSLLRYGKINGELNFFKKLKRISRNEILIKIIPSIDVENSREDQFEVKAELIRLDSVHTIFKIRVANKEENGAFVITNPKTGFNQRCFLDQDTTITYRDTDNSLISETLITHGTPVQQCELDELNLHGTIKVYDKKLSKYLIINY